MVKIRYLAVRNLIILILMEVLSKATSRLIETRNLAINKTIKV